MADRKDFLAAFVIGAIVGVGATMLLAPEPRQKKRFVYQLDPTRKRLRRRARKLRKVARGWR